MESVDNRLGPLLAIAAGYTLIMATIWSDRALQRRLFWVDAAFFLCAAVFSFRSMPFQLPQLDFTLIVVGGGLTIAAALLFAAAEVGTLHGLFGTRRPLVHAGMYLTWSVVQQWIQQSFFFVRLERILHRGVLASFTTAVMFGLAHLPNPVLTPVTFLGGWILSELYRRYRSVLPLGLAHGLVGLAIALAVPDQIQHHMRVGLGYLTYGG